MYSKSGCPCGFDKTRIRCFNDKHPISNNITKHLVSNIEITNDMNRNHQNAPMPCLIKTRGKLA